MISGVKGYINIKKNVFLDDYNRANTASLTVSILIQHYKLNTDSSNPIFSSVQKRDINNKANAIALLFKEPVGILSIDDAKEYIEAQELLFNQSTFMEPYKFINFLKVTEINKFYNAYGDIRKRVITLADRIRSIIQTAIIYEQMRNEIDTFNGELSNIPSSIELDFDTQEIYDGALFETALRKLIRKRRRERVFKEFRLDPINMLDKESLPDPPANTEIESNIKPLTCAVGDDFNLRECFLRRYPDVIN